MERTMFAGGEIRAGDLVYIANGQVFAVNPRDDETTRLERLRAVAHGQTLASAYEKGAWIRLLHDRGLITSFVYGKCGERDEPLWTVQCCKTTDMLDLFDNPYAAESHDQALAIAVLETEQYCAHPQEVENPDGADSRL